jgi:hypothetical protein
MILLRHVHLSGTVSCPAIRVGYEVLNAVVLRSVERGMMEKKVEMYSVVAAFYKSMCFQSELNLGECFFSIPPVIVHLVKHGQRCGNPLL